MSKEMARCGKVDFGMRVRQQSLRWVGKVRKREEGNVVDTACGLMQEVRTCVRQDMKKLDIGDDLVLGRGKWKKAIASNTTIIGKRTVSQEDDHDG